MTGQQLPPETEFDRYIERRGTGCLKWDDCHKRFDAPEGSYMLPMWVADMDFKAPQPVIDAIIERAKHGIFGYESPTGKVYEAIIGWMKRRYGWSIQSDWVLFTPGVVSGLNQVVQALTCEGEGILIQPPVYYPFGEIIKSNGRRIVNNPLVLRDGQYYMDYEDLAEKAADPSVTMMILCSPHNPGGRVWTPEELARVAEICQENGVVLASDEIHADLLMKGYKHVPTAVAAEKAASNLVACYAPSKTFNLPGLQTAYLVIPDEELRGKVAHRIHLNQTGGGDVLGLEAMAAAYTRCDDYVEELRAYVEANVDYMQGYLEDNLPQLKLHRPQGTYLVWVNFTGTGMDDHAFNRFLIERAHIAVDPGTWFGPGGEGYVRFNLGCPRQLVEQAMKQLTGAFDELK